MNAENEVLQAAEARAAALRNHDRASLTRMLHPEFTWTSHTGERFDRDSYLRSNADGPVIWHSQDLGQPHVAVLGTTAILTCVVTDDVSIIGDRRTYRMPMTQVWVREDGQWLLVAGHAGPRLDD